MFDDLVRQKNENPSIGIILCRNKKRTIVEYALRDTRRSIGVAKYKVVEKVPEKLKKELPAPETIKMLLGGV